jgi:hypothetical protein
MMNDDNNNIVGANCNCSKSDFTTLESHSYTRIIDYFRIVILLLSKKGNKGQKNKHFTTTSEFCVSLVAHENVTPGLLPFYSEPDCFHCAVEDILFQKNKENRESRHTVLPRSTVYVYILYQNEDIV